MKKIIHICNNNSFLVYQCTFDEQLIESKIHNLLNQQLEEYYYQEDQIGLKIPTTTSSIQTSSDLVKYLEKTILEKESIDLSEIYNLIQSHNSCMRTPQTLIAISNILHDFDYLLINDFNLNNYIILTNMAYRHHMMQANFNQNMLLIAKKNQYVLENLGIYLEDIQTYKNPKIIHK